MSSSNILINLSLPDDWMVEIGQRAGEQQLTPEEWLYVEVAKLLGKPDPRSAIAINNRLAALEAQAAAIPRLEQELQTLIALVKRLSPMPSVSSQPVSVSLPEDDEDEPDEILYDFLDG